MFLFCKKVLIFLLIKLLLILCENGLLTTGKTTVSASGNKVITGPFLQIEKQLSRLTITKPHLAYCLPCKATITENFYKNNFKFFYTWFRNDNKLIDPPKYRNGTLCLPPNERATGVYRCIINANETALLSEQINVEYPVLRRVLNISTNITALYGLPLTLNCPVVSVPPANISWYIGNTTLSKNYKDDSFIVLANGSLVLRNITLRENGKYKCLARNEFTIKNHRKITLTVTVDGAKDRRKRSQLIPYLQNPTEYVPQGDELKLYCSGVNNSVSIEWWFQRTTHSPLTKLNNDSNEYHISYATVEDHEGYYTCSIPNTLDTQTFYVIVTIPPKIIEPLPSYESLITSAMTLQCRISGNPKPIVRWYHNGSPLNSSYTRNINGNDLVFYSFDPDEAGMYQCFAHNIAGEVYSAAEIRLGSKSEEIRSNPLQNIRCFPHSSNTINVTFDSKATDPLFIAYIVQNNPYRWTAPFPPRKLNSTSYVILSNDFPYYRPFALIIRALFPTSEYRYQGSKPQQQSMQSSIRSPPITCFTQGLPLHVVYFGNDTFVTWSQPDLSLKKYFILQFSINYTNPHPKQMLDQQLLGTTRHVNLTQEDVSKDLTNIEPLNGTVVRAILKRAESKYIDNDARVNHLETDEDIFNLVVPANVSGVLMQNFTCIKLRVLIITSENENLAQDFRYVHWKSIDNNTSELLSTPFRLKIVESRMVVFHFQDNFNESCIRVCHSLTKYPNINKDKPICNDRMIKNSQLEVSGLKPIKSYRLSFSNCASHHFYGQLDVNTLPDPPGTISNQRITRHNGLKLSWDPPLQPNGQVHHYNIIWTLGNVTHEANVMECNICYYKFPNISESAKINVTVRVVGETGIGAPIFIDLRGINHHMIEIEQNSSTELYSGILIGTLLSVLCVVIFALIIILQRRRFKARQQGPVHLTSTSEMNFGNLSNTGIQCDSAGGLSGSTLQHEFYEMQTLIPKTVRRADNVTNRPNDYQTTPLPNGNKQANRADHSLVIETNRQGFDGTSSHNSSQLPLCSSTPERNGKDEVPQDARPFFIPFKNSANAVVTIQKRGIPPNLTAVCSKLPQTNLPLIAALPSGTNSNSTRRSGSLSNSSTGSASSSNKKQNHSSFSKHSQSIDGICLLAEEESAATLTPTSETVADSPMGIPMKKENDSHPIINDNLKSIERATTSSIAVTKPTLNSIKSNLVNLCNNSNQTNLISTDRSFNHQNKNKSIVPAGGSITEVHVSTPPNAKCWPKTTVPNFPISNAELSSIGHLYRRPNVDPNG
ncbi:uncharacterized protein LOC119681036 [Teleopsis dalmanni]|uniref:uncharacterized protein LOC119681036 n=1 Tax=Teleopsis dalmanni TaxID=139649 RepID=UPI0018CD5AF0|nr:uncharacterized protein LOC119681036 [Teleopsis dalmanni]